MELELFVADSRKALQEGRITKTRCPLKEFDVWRMWQGYYSHNEGLKEVFEDFVKLWESEWYSKLQPQAGLVRWDEDELHNEFIPVFPDTALRGRLKNRCKTGYATVWTIGPTLEDIVFAIVGKLALEAMFLDVACSLYLGVIRTALQDYVTEHYCDEGQMVIAEHSPEISYTSLEERKLDERLLHVVRPWSTVDAADKPAIVVNEQGVMKPFKAQCNMLFVGEKQEGEMIHLNEIPCSNCARERCLYSQFGGCHLPREKQPWLDTMLSK